MWDLGNHAQGVAMAAQKLGIKAKIVMPAACPAIKVCRCGHHHHDILYSCIGSSGEMLNDLVQKWY